MTKQSIIDLVLGNKPKDAVEMLLSKYEDRENKLMAIITYASQIRRSIYTNDANRHPHYETKMRWLLTRDISDEDANKVRAALQLPLQRQHMLHQGKKPYLSDWAMNRLFKAIKPIVDPYYEFILPSSILQAYKNRKRTQEVDQQMRIHKPSDHYSFTDDEINSIVDAAKGVVLHTVPTNITQYYNLLAALQIVTGRRSEEMVRNVIFTKVSHPFQAKVEGLSKQTSGDMDGTIIPLLMPFETVEKAIDRLRSYRNSYNNPNVSQGTSRACYRIFGRKLVHTQKRAIYTEAGFARRKENGFLPSATKYFWTAQALGHNTSGRLTATHAYMTLDVAHEVSSSVALRSITIPMTMCLNPSVVCLAICRNMSQLIDTEESQPATVVADPEVYPIYLKHMGSINARVLYDVNGCPLRDVDGNYINVWGKTMEDMFASGSIRLIHNIRPGYRYFIQHKKQMDDFLYNRKYGAEVPNLTYCIYEDEDIDKTPRKDHSKVVFLSSKKQYKPRKRVIIISP